MAVYEKYSFARTKAMASKFYHEHYGHAVPFEKGLSLLETESTVMDDGTPRGSVTGAVAGRYRRLFPIFITSPDPVLFPHGGMNMNYMKARFALEEPDLVFMISAFMTNIVDMMNYIRTNWKILAYDIAHGTIHKDVCEEWARPAIMPYVKANPKRAAELKRIFKQGFDTPIIPRIWPKFAWVCAIGTGGFVGYTEKFKKYAGDDIAIDYFVYAASEGMFATSTQMNDPEFMPLTDSCFLEFLPVDAPDGCNDTLTLDQLEDGQEYEVIITNLGGFYRYKIQDVIRVLGFRDKMPVITFAYRKSQMVNVAAEKTTEEHLNEAVKRFGREVHCDINDYALFVDDASDVSRYVFLLEPDTPLKVDHDGSYGRLMQKLLCEINVEYAFIDGRGSLGTPLVLIQQQQTHALWRELKLTKGASSNQVKPVRVLDTPMKQRFFFGLLEEGQEELRQGLTIL